jgi:hypothetical protein
MMRGIAGYARGMKRVSSTTARRAGLLAVAAALAAALAAVGVRLAPVRRAPAHAGEHEERPEPTYTCSCGATYRVSGSDRHRVYWLADAPEEEPVIGDRCVQCDAPLPAGRATASA